MALSTRQDLAGGGQAKPWTGEREEKGSALNSTTSEPWHPKHSTQN